MNKDLARKIIAIAASQKKSSNGLSLQDFVAALSFKRSLLDPETVKEFTQQALNEGLLVARGELFFPNFSTSGVVVPLDFSVTKEELFSNASDRPLVDRMLDAVSASGKLTKKEAIMRARELLSSMNYINFEIALLSILSEECIEHGQFVQELKKELLAKAQ
ncbi:MAG: DUF2240 family protein [Thermoplasmataceae archaeon]